MVDPTTGRTTGGVHPPQNAERSGEKKSFGIVQRTLSQANKHLFQTPPTKSEKNPFAEEEDKSFSLPKAFKNLKKAKIDNARSHFNALKKDKDATILDKASHLGKAAMSATAAAPFEIGIRTLNMLEIGLEKAPNHFFAVRGLKALVRKPEKFKNEETFQKLLKHIQHTDFSTQKDGAGVRKKLGIQGDPIKITPEQYGQSTKVIGSLLTESIFQEKKAK